MEPQRPKEQITIRDLFPDLGEDQLKEVEETFHSYLNALWRIYERLKRERPEVLTSERVLPNIR